jgi:nonribosomal peptide synthetase MxcG
MMDQSESQLYDQLLVMWKSLLGVEVINSDDNFFNLGGDSLQLVEMVVRLCGKYGGDFDYDQFFADPRIGTLVKILQKDGS